MYTDMDSYSSLDSKLEGIEESASWQAISTENWSTRGPFLRKGLQDVLPQTTVGVSRNRAAKPVLNTPLRHPWITHPQNMMWPWHKNMKPKGRDGGWQSSSWMETRTQSLEEIRSELTLLSPGGLAISPSVPVSYILYWLLLLKKEDESKTEKLEQQAHLYLHAYQLH